MIAAFCMLLNLACICWLISTGAYYMIPLNAGAAIYCGYLAVNS